MQKEFHHRKQALEVISIGMVNLGFWRIRPWKFQYNILPEYMLKLQI
jgi:hypothetical protein